MQIKSKHQLIIHLQKLSDKLNKIPVRAEFETSIQGGLYALRKYYKDNYTDLLKAAGLESFRDRQFLEKLNPEERNLKQLHISLNELKQDKALLKKQVAELIKDTVSSESLKKMIGVLNQRQFTGKMNWLKTNKISDSKGIPLLFLSDIHFDEVVMAEQIQGINKYNREIATKRLQHTFNTTINLLKKEIHAPKYGGIVLALGGDLLSGNIHEELAESNEAAILQSSFKLIDILIHGIDQLKKEFGKVFIPCVVGNHGRLFKKPRAKNKVFDNYEWLIYTFIQRHYQEDPDITVLIPDGPDIVFQVHNLNILLTHGDQFKGGSGISGIFTPLMLGMYRKQQKNSIIKAPFDVMMCGHFHQLLMTPFLIINGSVKGYDEYADQQNFKPERPQQALMIIHPTLGITHQMPVFCDNYEKKSEKSAVFKMT